MIFNAPNRLTSKSLPIVWKVGLDSSAGSTYTDLGKILVIPHLKGIPQAPIQTSVQTDTAGNKYSEIDLQGLLESYFWNREIPQTITTGQPAFDYSAYNQFWADNQVVPAYLEIHYYYIDVLGQYVEDLSLQEDTIEVFVAATTVQQQESLAMNPYLWGVGQKLLTYEPFGYVPTSATTGYEQNGLVEYPDRLLSSFASFFWDGGAMLGAVSFTLRDKFGGFYGTVVKHFDSPPTQFHNICTVSIAPQNLKSVPLSGWLPGAFTSQFVTNINIGVSAGWNRVRCQVAIAIGLGGGAYAYIPTTAFYYSAVATGCDFAAIYARNTLGGFDSYAFDLSKFAITAGTNSQQVRTPVWLYLLLFWVGLPSILCLRAIAKAIFLASSVPTRIRKIAYSISPCMYCEVFAPVRFVGSYGMRLAFVPYSKGSAYPSA